MINNDSKYHHLLPQVFMSSWVFDGDAVWGVNKETNFGDRKNKENFGGIPHYHTIRAGSYLATEKMVNTFFSPLQTYTVYFTEADEMDGNSVSDPFELNAAFSTYDEWILKDEYGRKAGGKRKRRLKDSILKHQDKTLEVEWNRQYEDHWNRVLKNIENDLDKAFSTTVPPYVVGFSDLGQIITFMVSMKWRTLPYPKELQELMDEKWSISPKYELDLKKLAIKEDEQTFRYLKTIYEEHAHNVILWLFTQFLNKEGPMMDEAQYIFENFTAILYQAPEDKEFLTSDNPVCEYKDENGKMNYYFPITPKLAFKFGEKTKGGSIARSYVVHQMNEEELIDFNNRMKDNSHEYYIMKGDHPSRYFGEDGAKN